MSSTKPLAAIRQESGDNPPSKIGGLESGSDTGASQYESHYAQGSAEAERKSDLLVHVRHLPRNVSEAEVASLVPDQSSIRSVTVGKRNQATLYFRSSAGLQKFLQTYTHQAPSVRGREVSLVYKPNGGQATKTVRSRPGGAMVLPPPAMLNVAHGGQAFALPYGTSLESLSAQNLAQAQLQLLQQQYLLQQQAQHQGQLAATANAQELSDYSEEDGGYAVPQQHHYMPQLAFPALTQQQLALQAQRLLAYGHQQPRLGTPTLEHDNEAHELTSLPSPAGLTLGNNARNFFPGQNAATANLQRSSSVPVVNSVPMYGSPTGTGVQKPNSAEALDRLLTQGSEDQPSQVLLVTIPEPLYPVSLDILYHVYSQYGTVLRIATFMQQGTFYALIEFQFVECAVAARMALHGKELFVGNTQMAVQYSPLTELNVAPNASNSRDFTMFPMEKPMFAATSVPRRGRLPASQSSPAPLSYLDNHHAAHAAVPVALSGPAPRRPLHVDHTYPVAMPSTNLFSTHRRDNSTPTPLGALSGTATGFTPVPPTIATQFSALNLHDPAYAQRDFGAYDARPLPANRGCVILISNLNEEKVTTDVLFTLFGAFGNVMRVKIFYNKKDTALIQFQTPVQAYQAHMHLNHVELFGRPMSISPSKNAQVVVRHPSGTSSPPPGGGPPLTKDYSASPLHRFTPARPSAARHISAPGPVLHVANLPIGLSAEEVAKLFGDQITAVQFFKNDHRMAFLRFRNTGAAVNALATLHNFPIGDRLLRVSFAHKNPDALLEECKEVSTQEALVASPYTDTYNTSGHGDSLGPQQSMSVLHFAPSMGEQEKPHAYDTAAFLSAATTDAGSPTVPLSSSSANTAKSLPAFPSITSSASASPIAGPVLASSPSFPSLHGASLKQDGA